MEHEEVRPGFYLDANGVWQKDRRKQPDRRLSSMSFEHHERRVYFRRKADRELYERLHKPMMQEALAEFAEEHPQRPE